MPAGAVQDFEDLQGDPQLAAREHFVERGHPALGQLQLEHSGFRLSESPHHYATAGPTLGEHTDSVLRDILGISDEEIEKLRESEVLV